MVCGLLAICATFLSEHFGGPQLLYALLLGLAFHFLSADPKIQPGLNVCGRTLLRLGVVLLGARITVDQVLHLGWVTALILIAGVALTIGSGVWLARRLGCRRDEGLLSGGAVAICGASAALAIASVLPQNRQNERFTLMVVVSVTVLSTLAMIAYPMAVKALAWDPVMSGVFLGGTIHDVAQVVAAGMMLGPQSADTATIVKLFRVMLLVPVVLVLGWYVQTRRGGSADTDGDAVARASGGGANPPGPLVPLFLLGFMGMVAISSLGLVSPAVGQRLGDASRLLLVMAIASVGVKTSFEELLKLGWRPLVLMLAETLVLASWVALGLVLWFHRA